MARPPSHVGRSAFQCLHCKVKQDLRSTLTKRGFYTSTRRQNEAPIETLSPAPVPPPPPPLDPNSVTTPRMERRLVRTTGLQPIGSRRRRAALQSTANIPFEQLPYQCFQEARKVLLADREEKLKQIEEERKRIAKAQAVPAEKCGGEYAKKGRIVRMQKYLEELKILADVNDPVIKKRFEDGDGDMNRPIYRYLADRQWRQYKRLVLMQRINQMNVVPDVVPHLDPTAEVTMAFSRRNVQPGDFVDSRVSEILPRLKVQVFNKGGRLISIAVVDPDVPNVETDGFDSRCHFIAVNIPISPTSTSVPLSRLSSETQVIRPWLPPHAQKGSPYHRLIVFVLEQKDGAILELEALRNYLTQKEEFNQRNFNDKFHLKPIGITMFRTIWDEGTADVMKRAGLQGADIELKRKKPEKLPYKKKDGARYR